MLSNLLPLLLFLLEWLGAGADDFEVELEPGHLKPEYDSIEEVRGHENETETEKPAEDEHLTREAILDVAYYLRRFKFSGHDPRYLAEGEIPKQNLFVEFPSPPLRNIHWEKRLVAHVDMCSGWKRMDGQRESPPMDERSNEANEPWFGDDKPSLSGERQRHEERGRRRLKKSIRNTWPILPVTPREVSGMGFPSQRRRRVKVLIMLASLLTVRKNCEPSFVECVKYLQEQVSQTVLPRHLDSLTITKQNGWSFITDRDLIKAADDECLRLLEQDRRTFNAFSGPLQRFQWLTSATYYMCLYTMKETAYLRNFTEDCDNFASCIPWEFGLNNKDVRGDNARPFACASYSFCPDPCCPLKHLLQWSTCDGASPCPQQKWSNSTCSLYRKDNVYFEALTLNQWNISCNCDAPGTHWESKSGMCVDIDECTQPEPPCSSPAETCRNLPGAYTCTCNTLGYRRNPKTLACVPDPVLRRAFSPRRSRRLNETNSLSKEFSSKLQSIASTLKSNILRAVMGDEEGPNRNQTV